MAGWSTQEMLDGVQSTLNLAKIGATDLGTASDILTDDLTALGMQANQAGDFADKLAATITRSNTDVVLFGESMKQTGAIAGALGASMTDLSTSIGLMANAGIKGSKAGMSLKNMLAKILVGLVEILFKKDSAISVKTKFINNCKYGIINIGIVKEVASLSDKKVIRAFFPY